MQIAVIGAGPAGLFLSLLLKRRRPRDEVFVLEQNARGATFGFGVVLSDGALEFLRAGEPEIFELLGAQMEHWPEQKIVHRDEADEPPTRASMRCTLPVNPFGGSHLDMASGSRNAR